MVRINRSDFLRRLECVFSAVAPKETEIQSNCFIFKDGEVHSFDGEQAVSFESLLGSEVYGAVKADKLVKYLQKINHEEIEIEGADNELSITCGRETVAFPKEKEILLPIDSLDRNEEWKPLPDGFLGALDLVKDCAAAKNSKQEFVETVVNIHPKWIESGDATHVVRYRIKTPIGKPALLRRTSLATIVSLGVTEFSETAKWTHFRNSEGLVYSCRCFSDAETTYESATDDISNVFNGDDGAPATLPKGLAEVALRAAGISDDAKVYIELWKGKMRVQGRGAAGEKFNSGKIKVAYDGDEMKFLIAPKLLSAIAEKHSDVYITDRHLKIKGSCWKYATALGAHAEENGKAVDEESAALEGDG